MNKKAIIIGAGFAGISAASFMARAGWSVTVLEKHSTPGGRARQLQDAGFSFDMGPSWYWMHDVFERYFAQFGKKVGDYYSIKRLDPSYRIYWDNGFTDIPADITEFKKMLNDLEEGAGNKLDAFLKEAEYKYKIGIQKLVFKPGRSVSEFMDWQMIRGVFRLDVFTSMKKHISKYFSHPRIRQMLEFPVLFLGALPEDTPALYSLMNYADIIGGTWYPSGGMYSVVKAMHGLAEELGVVFRFNEEVQEIKLLNGTAKTVETTNSSYDADIVIGGADYHFIESRLLPAAFQSYSPSYWENREMAPSCLLYYVGLSKKLKNVLHHSLFFDVSFDRHGEEIYKTKRWPVEPLFYVSVSSVTDDAIAPPGCENLVFLVPVAAGLTDDTAEMRDKYFSMIVERFEQHVQEPIADFIVYKKSFGYSDFVHEYNSFKGNAYGLANTLLQTAIFRPACRSKKIKNLFFTGQLTVPGPGVPPSLISGEVVAKEVLKHY
ncbi:MAG: phytoene desaturase [Chitinophagaceae bacterium]|nr:phytoene desaturase [Chitinophagaceae bacterium]